MAGKIEIESAMAVASLTRRQPLLITSTKMKDGNNRNDKTVGRRGSRMGETAGECAALCCCCPCAMMHLFFLAVYRLPTGLCKKAWREKKRKGLLKKKRKNFSSEEKENQRTRSHMNMFGFDYDDDDDDYRNSEKNDAVDWDKEMWEIFDEAGFGRSASQRAEID